MMTFNNAAVIVLKQEQKELTAREIWTLIEEQNLIQSTGTTPVASLSAILGAYSINSKHKKPSKFPLFFRIEGRPDKFKLLENCDTSDLDSITEIEKECNIIEDLEKQNMNEPESEIEEKEDQKIIVKSVEKIFYEITDSSLNWKKLVLYYDDQVLKYELVDCKEYTYLIEDSAHKTVKIGKTKNSPNLRLDQLKTSNPSIQFLHVFPSSLYSEKTLHKKFDELRNELEWFFKAKKLTTFINKEINIKELILTWYHQMEEVKIIESQINQLITN